MSTSGSTGTPKTSLLSFNNVYTQGVSAVGNSYNLGPEDVIVAVAPINLGSVGYTYAVFAALVVGAQAHILQRWNAEAALSRLSQTRATVGVAVPTQMIMMLNEPVEKYNLDALRVIITAGAPLPPSTASEFERRFGCITIKAYGATDGGMAALTNIETPEFQRFNTVGRVMRGDDLKIIVDGAVAPIGTRGEIVWRSPAKSFGYLNQPALDEQAWRDGYFFSGDLGVLDEDGYLSIVGRVKEMILRGGHNIFPAEIESLLVEHPAIDSAAVVGVPDDRLGERACAVITLAAGYSEPGLAELQRYLDERNLAKYKFPELLVLVDELPRNAGAKLDRRRIEDIARAALERKASLSASTENERSTSNANS
jgi:acyl-CoA synthetase (AMP-forming)/AMP-acid ligase II